MRLLDNTIVVTGASGGLGRAMADAFVDEGGSVVYSSRSMDRTKAAVASIRDGGAAGEATAVQADVRSWDGVKRLVRRSVEAFGDIDLFVNNAGVSQPSVNHDHTWRPVHELPLATWDTVLDTNLRGAFLCTKAVLPGMLEHDRGRLLHISSGHGTAGRPKRAAYVASKFGLEGFHEALAQELEDTGVESMTLRPPGGGVYTESSALQGRDPDSYAYEHPRIMAEAAVQLAAGEGENGGRYQVTPDGAGFEGYSRSP